MSKPTIVIISYIASAADKVLNALSDSEPKVTFEIVPGGKIVRLTVAHGEFEENSVVYRACSEAWRMILSSLKTLLETGDLLPELKSAANAWPGCVRKARPSLSVYPGPGSPHALTDL